MAYSIRRIPLVTVLALALSLVAVPPALADEVGGHVNSVRSGSLPVLAGADQVAGASAAAQAAAGDIFHANLSGLLGTCDSVGEVVGTGPDVPSVFSAFRQSSSHWSIITNPAWTAMGTGLATGTDGMVYVAVVFCRQTSGAAPSVAPPPAGVPSVTPPPAPGNALVRRIPATPVIAAARAEVPVLDEVLPARGARRMEIRTRLDPQAESVLPDWYVGVCGTEDRDRVLEPDTSDSGTCPKAS